MLYLSLVGFNRIATVIMTSGLVSYAPNHPISGANGRTSNIVIQKKTFNQDG
jgi:hypothetical protein